MSWSDPGIVGGKEWHDLQLFHVPSFPLPLASSPYSAILHSTVGEESCTHTHTHSFIKKNLDRSHVGNTTILTLTLTLTLPTVHYEILGLVSKYGIYTVYYSIASFKTAIWFCFFSQIWVLVSVLCIILYIAYFFPLYIMSMCSVVLCFLMFFLTVSGVTLC